MKKKKGYRASTSSVRQDYREGGRVQAANGGILTYNEWFDNYKKDNPRPSPRNYRASKEYDANLPQLYSEFVVNQNNENN